MNKDNIDIKRPDGKVPADQLTRVAFMASQMQELDNQIKDLESQLKAVNEKRWRVATEDLPGLMEEFGLSEFKLKDGSKVTIRPYIKASLPSEGAIMKAHTVEERTTLRERLNCGMLYLRRNGAGALIKHMLKADFGKDSDELARKALAVLRKLGVKANLSKNVHPQTLQAWVRERLEAGKPVDMELFAVFAGQQAHIEQPFTVKYTEEKLDDEF